MKSIFVVALLFLNYHCFCQLATPSLYGEYDVFIDEEFNDNIFYKITFGSELTSYKFIAPEVDVSYYYGLNSQEMFGADQTGPPTYAAYLNEHFEGFIWGFSPKLFYEEEGTRVVLIPKYHFGKIQAIGNFLDSDNIRLEKKITAKMYYWSFALGIEESKWSNNATYGFYLIYNGLNAGKALNQLDFNAQSYSKDNYNTRTIGLGIRISYNFKTRDQII
ncbi:hypothetical protein [Maribacter ulvicola]|uniref:Outer membrane protein beta-barrel domain-containing protein n=1 Tax=Maribacter ulvicola TaxID=228959 RepID=A0A1N6PVQ0_9FLAO|nr:hypothetical protein [Maribacter ulvicola]SIQ08434.1 hypothetical protein SAMN05421797_101616 [Maribacter ulvicola]